MPIGIMFVNWKQLTRHMSLFIQPVRFVILITVIAGLLNTSCKKEEIPGPKGEPGTPGGGGNTSINTSGAITVPSVKWQANADSSRWETSIESTLITQSVADKGAVKVYIYRNAAWWELPFTEEDLFMQFGFTEGTVYLSFMDIHGGLPEKPGTAEFRIVTITESNRTILPLQEWNADTHNK